MLSRIHKFKDDLIKYKCLCFNKNYQRMFDRKLKEYFFNTYKFLTMMIISLFYYCKKVFILMNIEMIGKKFNEMLLPEKEHFRIHLNMEDIT